MTDECCGPLPLRWRGLFNLNIKRLPPRIVCFRNMQGEDDLQDPAALHPDPLCHWKKMKNMEERIYRLPYRFGTFVVNVTQTSYQAEENSYITLKRTFTTRPSPFDVEFQNSQRERAKELKDVPREDVPREDVPREEVSALNTTSDRPDDVTEKPTSQGTSSFQCGSGVAVALLDWLKPYSL